MQHVDNNCRYIVLNVLIDNDPVLLVNYYATNVESEQLKLVDELNHIFNSLEMAENTIGRFLPIKVCLIKVSN